jgi:5'-3' exonuclease
MNSKFNYVLIDGSNLYHRSYSLFKPNGKNIINHLLETVDKIQNDFSNNESILYFIFDNSQSQINLRKNIDPLYKSNREKGNNKEIYKYHNIFIELLKVRNQNYKILMAGSLEADDLVKPLINYIDNLEKNYYKILLISNDMDWSRNINDKVYWYNWNTILNKEEFYSKYKFFPSEEGIKIYKSIKGDSSDNISPGIYNFPMNDLINICDKAYNFNSYKDFLNYIETLNENLKQTIKSNLRNIKRNYSLVDFINIKIDIGNYIKNCKQINLQYRLMLEGLGVTIPDNLKNKSEMEKDFFNI